MNKLFVVLMVGVILAGCVGGIYLHEQNNLLKQQVVELQVQVETNLKSITDIVLVMDGQVDTLTENMSSFEESAIQDAENLNTLIRILRLRNLL